MYGFAILHAVKAHLCCLKSWDIFGKSWNKLHDAIHIHGDIRSISLWEFLTTYEVGSADI